MAVDIGAEAIDRAYTCSTGYTRINAFNPATIDGQITLIDIWAETDITGLRVGTFYKTNGVTLKCRDSEAIAGTITAGSKVVKDVSIAVEIGDYIGCYFTGGKLEYDTSGFDDVYSKTGEYIDPGDEASYTLNEGHALSLGGYIEERVAVGRSRGEIIG